MSKAVIIPCKIIEIDKRNVFNYVNEKGVADETRGLVYIAPLQSNSIAKAVETGVPDPALFSVVLPLSDVVYVVDRSEIENLSIRDAMARVREILPHSEGKFRDNYMPRVIN